MNIDQRLDRLTERHEALTQTVELLALENQKNAADIRALTTLIRQMAEGITGLASIVRNHEQRISGLES